MTTLTDQDYKEIMTKDTVDHGDVLEIKDCKIIVVNDVNTFSTEDWTTFAWGSIAYCIEDKKVYIFNQNREWGVFR